MTHPRNRDAELDWAIRLHSAGILDQAAEEYRRLIAERPHQAEARLLLATIELGSGDAEAAVAGFAHAVAGLDRPEEALAGLSEALGLLSPSDRSRVAGALAGSEALARDPAAAALVARTLKLLGQAAQALALVEAALPFAGEEPDLLRLRASLMTAPDLRSGAVDAYRRALAVAPDDIETLVACSAALVRSGRPAEALSPAARAAGLSLGQADTGLRRIALARLGDCHRELGRPDDAVEACRTLTDRAPELPETWSALARSLHAAGRHAEAEAAAGEGLRRSADDIELRWLHCFYALAPLYRSTREIADRRAAYGQRLRQLASRLETATAGERERAAWLLGDANPFLLPYQYGKDDRDLQASFGAMAQQLSGPQAPSVGQAEPQNGRISVIFASAFIWRHTNWRMKRGWVKHLDRTRFHVSCLHLGGRVDAMTEEVRGWSDAFHHFPDDFDGGSALLRELRPDVIFYPEVGMSGAVQRLAALRLAPVQCCAWGHPVTTGLATMDYFISSELMEPEDADEHYTETLIRLPGISFPYIPTPLDASPLARRDLGLPDGRCLYLCLQTPQKYLPADDDLYPRIAARVGDALFVFLAGGSSLFDMSVLEGRLHAAFAAQGLDPDRHLRFLPHLSPERYQALNALGDVYLDTPGWSGGNTTLEALQQDLPVVTLPGRVMRARHSAAMLRLIGVEETIAQDKEDYVRIAARLGCDPAYRAAVAGKIRAMRNLLETDMRSIGALERFLESAVAQARGGE